MKHQFMARSRKITVRSQVDEGMERVNCQRKNWRGEGTIYWFYGTDAMVNWAKLYPVQFRYY